MPLNVTMPGAVAANTPAERAPARDDTVAPGEMPTESGATPEMLRAAKDFEAYMFGFIFERAFESVPRGEIGDAGYAGEVYRSLFVQEVAKQGAESGRGLGLADYLLRTMKGRGGLPQENAGEGVGEVAASNRPVDPFSLTTPVREGEITSPYGLREDPITGRAKMHHGVDVALAEGTPVRAASSGEVIYSGRRGGYGNTVILRHGNGFETWYAHQSSNTVPVGAFVRQGEVVGLSGNSGRSTGPHLHFEVRKDGKPINPNGYVKVDTKI